VEELSACLLGFRSPHVVLYAASAIQALQGRSPAHLTSTLIPNGVLPLVGRPEDLQVSGGVRLLAGIDIHHVAPGLLCVLHKEYLVCTHVCCMVTSQIGVLLFSQS
jgi:hypothetical protein